MAHDQVQYGAIRSAEDLGKLVRAHRKQRKLTLETISGLGNLSTRFLSEFERGKETAELAFGKVEISNYLYFTFRASEEEKAANALGLRAMLGSKPAAGTNSVVVSHTANLREAAGVWPKPEGVAVIFEPTDEGGFEYVGTIKPDEWENY